MKITVALTIVAALASAQAYGQTKENRTLTEAKAYTDTQVAAERAARVSADGKEVTDRTAADNQEAQLRVAGDADLQSQIDDLNSPKRKTITVSGRSFQLTEPSGYQRYEAGSGCVQATGFISVDLQIPEGSRIIDSSVLFNRNTETGRASAQVSVYTNDPSVIYTPATFESNSGLGFVTVDPVPMFFERTLEAGDVVNAFFASFDATASICRLSVTYIEP